MAHRADRTTRLGALFIACCLALAISVPARAQSADTPAGQLQLARDAHDNGDYELAFDLVAPLADIGIAEGRHLLARLHLKSEFAGFDAFEAFRVMELAAEQGLPVAQHDLAQMYRNGVGTERDALASFSWHLRAARQRFSRSERAIASMYASGEGVERNDAQAAKWAARAARSDQAAKDARPTPPPVVVAAQRSPPATRLPVPTPDSARAEAGSAPPAPPAPVPAPEASSGTPPATATDSAEPTAVAAAAPAGTPAGTPAEPQAVGNRRYTVQLGAYRDAALAEQVHARILATLPDDGAGSVDLRIATVDKRDGNGEMHRIVAGPLAELSAAQSVCRQVTASLPRQGCFVLRSRR